VKIKKTVSDLGIAAYVLMQGYELLGKKDRDFYFEVDDSEERKFDELKISYLVSEFHYFDHCLMGIKKLEDFNHSIESKCFVTDLGAAAYLLMHKFRILGKKGKSYFFDIFSAEENIQFQELNLQYANSEFHNFDSKLMSLKKIGSFLRQNR
jgi:hypothetical protein